MHEVSLTKRSIELAATIEAMLSGHCLGIVACGQVFSLQPAATHVQMEDIGGFHASKPQ